MNDKKPIIYAELTASQLSDLLSVLDVLGNIRTIVGGKYHDWEIENVLIETIMDMCGFSDYYNLTDKDLGPRSLCLEVAHDVVCDTDHAPKSRAETLMRIYTRLKE